MDAQDVQAERAQGQARRKERVMSELARFPFQETWWIRGPNLQTVWSPYFRRVPKLKPRKERWNTPDTDFIELHFTEGQPDKPLVLLLHGLEGSAQSNYIAGLMDAFSRRGWATAALEFRSCSGQINRAKRLYHSGETTDLEFVIGELIKRRPHQRIYIAGFSLGGNVTAKWLGQAGEKVPWNVAAAAVVCPPFDLTQSGPQIDRAARGMYVRQYLKSLIPKALEKAKQYPGVLDVEKIKKCKTFAEFDTHATAALHGFRDAMDYWASVSCGQFLAGIRRPTLLVASADDPFNPASTLPHELAARSPYLHPLFTQKGGHVGFVHGPSPVQSRHWAEEQIVRFFTTYEEGHRPLSLNLKTPVRLNI